MITLVSYYGEEKLFPYPLRFSVWGLQIKLTKDRLAREKRGFYSHTYVCGGFTEKSDLRRLLEFRAYIILIGEGEWQKDTLENGFLIGEERAFRGKQITFKKDKWALWRVDDRYDSFVTMSI